MTGPHPRDPFSLLDDGADFSGAPSRSVEDLKVAYSLNFGIFPVDRRVREIVGEAVRSFEGVGALVEEVGVGIQRSQRELCELWMRQIGMLNADVLEGMKAGGIDLLGEHRGELTPQYAELVESARRTSALDYKLDDLVRTEVFDAVQDVFEEYDVLVTPTLAVPPFDNAEDGNTVGPSRVEGEEVDPLLGWCLTYPINFTGHPAASVPAGFTDGGLPVGMQVVGQRFDDEIVLALSAALERVRPWRDSYPPRPA
jgi:amidase/aspartyl-tRNA(Asn)/glutamyl-tRNA(Gln) amidotransferase subunit A